jgi:hypothetical protein
MKGEMLLESEGLAKSMASFDSNERNKLVKIEVCMQM